VADFGTEGEGTPTAVHMTFAYLKSKGGEPAFPVWVITYEGTCVPVDNGVGTTPPASPLPRCRLSDDHVIIHADTGEYVANVVDTSLKI
jgi:hypothetical protein